jgi:ubiquinone/menaquinone biosynthesis C-methylase UbiE
MTDAATHFDDGAAYERFMGRWSRAVGTAFLDWMAPPAGARWLDVGCGSGALTELIVHTCAPSAIIGVDPAEGQIDYARRQPTSQGANFQLADAQDLPFPDGAFDVVASAFVINFIPDRPRALAEMRRVTCSGGMVAGCVWDFAGEHGPNRPLRLAMREFGAEVRQPAGAHDTTLAALEMLFARGGLDEIATKAISVSVEFSNFDDLWRSQTPPLHPMTKTIAALPDRDRAKLVELVRAELPARPDGRVSYSARAHAIKARVPA